MGPYNIVMKDLSFHGANLPLICSILKSSVLYQVWIYIYHITVICKLDSDCYTWYKAHAKSFLSMDSLTF